MYVTEHGEFPTLQQLRAAYLRSKDGEKYWLDPTPFAQSVWEPRMLHASDVGGCARQAMYRMLGTPEKPRSKSSAANREIMFWAGYRFHYLTYSALEWAGLLISYERPLTMPPGWTGQCDALFLEDHSMPVKDNLVLYDCKTVLPNALKYSWDMPKKDNVLQVTCYAHHFKADLERLGHIKIGLIEYTDRAGSNTPKECPIDTLMMVPDVLRRMQYLELCAERLPALPPTLPPVLVPSYWKKRNEPFKYLKTVTLKTPWNCGYCDYHLTEKVSKDWSRTCSDSTCKPTNNEPKVIAEFAPNGHCTSVDKMHLEALDEFLETMPRTIPIEEEEDD
jgi:hypothetical protein